MPESIDSPQTNPTLDPDTLDDILYLCRTGELSELQSTLSSVSSHSPPSILSSAADSFSGNSALHMAAANGHTETLKYLLDALSCGESTGESEGVTSVHPLLDRPNEAGNTPLHWAAVNGQLDAVKLLVNAGADPNIKNGKGYDAAFEAEGAGREEVVAYLLLSMKDEGGDEQEVAETEEGTSGGKSEKTEAVEGKQANGNG